jgi:hypothetical protein
VSRFLRAVLWDSTSTPDNDYDDGDSSYSEHHAEAAINNITNESVDTTTNTNSANSTATATTGTHNSAAIYNRISSVDIPIGDELLDKLASIFSIAQVR